MSRAGATKNPSSSIRENYFETTYPPLPLPMIWRVIYHEAMRGNHILWERNDLDAIEQKYQTAEFQMTEEDRNVITKFMVRFLGCSDFRELQAMIRELTISQKAVAFVLYRRSISVWQRWLKTNLH